ncbi:hypothetical protein FUA23_09410 [Neolewinella aurantiaca]|uniref:Outer membrane protein beta-barrel domain-containing protein n=1 Tax=Neolewinella aurantiaca TaxID=2602767 RepID=A0A5C7FVN3_9BACT|nr:hypothetical protein [Neolewinella aurantiaca]TXF89657.1 hypothetical protein FUA23_09410 [Neolewinella aurantiaca]
MKLSLLTALALCISHSLFAQQDDSPLNFSTPEETHIVQRGLSIHVMPASVVNFLPRLRAGIEYKPSRFGFLIDVEHGSDFTQGLIGMPNNTDYNFIGIRPEIRFDPIPTFTPFYVGIEVPVTEVRRRKDGDFDAADGRRLRVEDALQDRFRVSVIAKFGIRHIAWERMMLDVYFGFGGAKRNVTYSDAARTTTAPEEFLHVDQLFSDDLYDEGTRYVPELAAGVRMGYWFGRK